MKLSKDELREKGIRLPGGLAAKLAVRPNGNGKGAAPPSAESDERDDGHEPAAEADEGGSLPLLSIEGGGTLVFGEYGRLKYHVRNRVLSAARQTKRIADLWKAGQIVVERDDARYANQSLSALHRARSLGGRRLPAEGW